MNKSKMSTAIYGVVGAAFLFGSISSFADDHNTSEIEEVIVTGSLITNTDAVRSTPIVAIEQEEMEYQGIINVEEMLREVPGMVPSINANVNNGNGGFSYVNLRGLGSNRNLVLIDGNRYAPSELAGRFDLNNIPIALIDRIDVLTGGTSSTYGADAVAGVVARAHLGEFGRDGGIGGGVEFRLLDIAVGRGVEFTHLDRAAVDADPVDDLRPAGVGPAAGEDVDDLLHRGVRRHQEGPGLQLVGLLGVVRPDPEDLAGGHCPPILQVLAHGGEPRAGLDPHADRLEQGAAVGVLPLPPEHEPAKQEDHHDHQRQRVGGDGAPHGSAYLPEDDRRVGAAEAEGVRQRHVDLARFGLVRGEAQLRRDLGIVEVDRRRRHLVADREDRAHQVLPIPHASGDAVHDDA